MKRKLPAAAFEFYFGLGPERSYAAVGKHFGVVKQTVVATARSEDWQGRLKEKERQTAAAVAKKTDETLEAMRDRHLRTLKAIQGKALEALKAMPLDNASQAVKALLASLAQERVVRDAGAAAGANDLEAIVRREFTLYVKKPGAKDDWDDDDG
jgi:hypothetical protein